MKDQSSRMSESSEVSRVIDPEDKDFAEIIKGARKKLELPTALAVPCKRTKSQNGVTCVQKDDHKIQIDMFFGSR